ncbi:MAG: PAS domain-containing protein [Bacteroidetes bacterium]|nr:PAS domain-containing protein [Bacteroidota bacterium]
MELSEYLDFKKHAYDRFKDGILFTNKLMQIVYLNDTAQKLFGAPEDQLINKNIKEVSNQIFLLISSSNDKNSPYSGKIVPQAINFTNRNKITYSALTFISQLGDKHAELGYVIIIQDPISASELDISTIYARMPFLRALNIKNDEFFYISDFTSGRNIFCSDSVEKFLGWEPFNFVNGTWAFAISKIHPDDVHIINKVYKQRLRWQKFPYKYDHIPQSYSYRMLHKKGHYVYVNINAALLQRNNQNEPLYIISFGKTSALPDQLKDSSSSRLTPRESQLLTELEHGRSYKMAAAELNISINSVRTYIRRIYQKLEVHSITEAIHKNSRSRRLI